MILRFYAPSDNPLNLTYKNDGKCKSGSAEARISTSFYFAGSNTCGDIALSASEETEEQAQKLLLSGLQELIKELQRFHDSVERLPPETPEQRDLRLGARRGLLY